MQFTKECEYCHNDFPVRERGKQRTARKFCGNSCQAKAREEKFRKRFGFRRPFRRVIDDSTIQKGLDLMITGMRAEDAANNIGVCTSSLLKRARELGYDHCARGRGWSAAKLKIPKRYSSLGYVAAIIDGEGSIIRVEFNRQIAWRVSVTNTNRDLMDYLERIGGRVFKRRKRKGSLGKKKCYIWAVLAQLDVLRLLEAVVPFMIVKAAKAKKAIQELRSVMASWVI